MNLNRIILIGRLTNDPEERFSNDGMEISKFRLAVSRPGRSRERERDGERADADFFNVVCFRNSAKFVNQYMRRGNLVAVEGRLEMDEYTDREGQRRTWTQVVADNVQSLQTRAESEGGGDDRAERRGGRWEHDRDFEEGDEAPKGRDDRERAPRENGRREEREPAGRGGRREEFRPREEAPRGASAAGGSYDNDDDDPFAGE